MVLRALGQEIKERRYKDLEQNDGIREDWQRQQRGGGWITCRELKEWEPGQSKVNLQKTKQKQKPQDMHLNETMSVLRMQCGLKEEEEGDGKGQELHRTCQKTACGSQTTLWPLWHCALCFWTTHLQDR